MIAESRSRDGSTSCRRVFRAVKSVPGLMKEAYCPERAHGAKFSSSYVQEKTKAAKATCSPKLLFLCDSNQLLS